MLTKTQDNFRRRVRRYLADRDMSMNELAAKVGKRRDTVSKALRSAKYPRVRAIIAAHISHN